MGKCYYDNDVCEGELWECETCHESYCAFHSHQTDKGFNVECVACERARIDRDLDSLQGCRESDRIAEGLDAMGKPAQDDESPIGAMTEEEKQEYRLDQLDDAEKEIVNPFDTMDWGDGKAKPLETIDITPVGCQTPAGNQHVNRALEVIDRANCRVAQLATEMVETLARNEQYPSEKLDTLKEAIAWRKAAYRKLFDISSGR